MIPQASIMMTNMTSCFSILHSYCISNQSKQCNQQIQSGYWIKAMSCPSSAHAKLINTSHASTALHIDAALHAHPSYMNVPPCR